MQCWMQGSPECHNCPQHEDCYSKEKLLVARYCEKYDSCDAIKMIVKLREGYKRLLKLYEGGDIEMFCMQILDHTKEYEDRAIIQQVIQPDNGNTVAG